MDIEIILTGSFGVGKSSIFNRFIHNEFSNKYYGTLGVRVNEKELTFNDITFKVKLWDIAGEVKQAKVPKSYFHSPSIIIYVVDLNRTFGIENIPADLDYLREVAKGKKVIIIGNKVDLLDPQAVINIKKDNPKINFSMMTSAKTGENIDALFESIALYQLEISS